ncbi:MAG: carbohydrate ABC transporter permease [Spirochaetaceae bacterium]|nr:MAG: carbohydrate ABC transporter permease [Spirochaetaceae bacterium]
MGIIRKMQAFDYINYAFLILFALTTFYPFWNILVISVSTDKAFFSDWYHIIPKSFTLRSYLHNFQEVRVLRALSVSVFITVVGTVSTVTITSMAAFFLSKPYLRLRNLIFILFVITMFFNGGLIPLYIVVAKLKLRNTVFALFLPTLMNIFFLILTKNYFAGMPDSMEESAKIDGANAFTILFRIILPSAKPIIATISLFYAVQFWNDWFNGLLYLTDRKLYPLSLYLREVISAAITQEVAAVLNIQAPATIRASAIVITIFPIILVYPFIQKHFVKGILLGSTKE